MSHNRTRRRCVGLAITALLAVASMPSTAVAQNTSQLSGFVYIDRNNDGALAFSDEPSPEWVLPNISIELYSVSGMTATLLSTTTTNDIGQYFFENLAAGAYALRQIQPVEYVDGLDTVGAIRSLVGQLNPPGANVGTAGNNVFTNIVLPASARGDLYNFGERGLAPAYVSKRYLLGSAPPPIFSPPPIPEPATGILAVLGSLAILATRRR